MPAKFPFPDRIRYDSQCFTIEGKDTFIYSGAFHYFRCPKELWSDRFQKITEAGFNAVESYVPWNYHEPQPPSSAEDFSRLNLTELEEWISMAEGFGLHTIIRPGPYICAEWAGGGFPYWLVPLFKPKGWRRDAVWLQTDDPQYLAWNWHWYGAVCKVVAPHQITRKPPGCPGVILFQIENEYERIKWIDDGVKTRHLAALARQARSGGIEVPLVTCWTSQTRNSPHPDLRGIFDFINSYPKWEIGTALQENAEAHRKEQPDVPTAAMELQAGWYSEIGGQLSADIDGVAPVQTQNLALFCIQIGYTAINFYMLVGGTNLDSWASREATASYDFFAPIREHGGVGDKYRRVAAIGAMLREHGARLARSVVAEVAAEVSDPAVQVAVRAAADGTRYIFVRTADRSARRAGTCLLREPSGREQIFEYELEPFGSKVLVLEPQGCPQGEWFPKTSPAVDATPGNIPPPLEVRHVEFLSGPLPQRWEPLAPGEALEARGINDAHFLYYRTRLAAGSDFTVERLGGMVICRTMADGIYASAGGQVLVAASEADDAVAFSLPEGAGGEVILLYENAGLHHHTDLKLEEHWACGIRQVKAGQASLSLEYAAGERELGLRLSLPDGANGLPMKVVPTTSSPPGDSLLSWFRFQFELPEQVPGIWVPWHLNLVATGNGFIYLNGRCIGRTWEAGPQREFFLPECWLNFGAGKTNAIALSLCPGTRGAAVRSALIVPSAEFAEYRGQAGKMASGVVNRITNLSACNPPTVE